MYSRIPPGSGGLSARSVSLPRGSSLEGAEEENRSDGNSEDGEDRERDGQLLDEGLLLLLRFFADPGFPIAGVRGEGAVVVPYGSTELSGGAGSFHFEWGDSISSYGQSVWDCRWLILGGHPRFWGVVRVGLESLAKK